MFVVCSGSSEFLKGEENGWISEGVDYLVMRNEDFP